MVARRKVARKKSAKKATRKPARKPAKKAAKKARCAGKTLAGTRCKRPVSGKGKFCAVHAKKKKK